jgi:hypothetical protein
VIELLTNDSVIFLLGAVGLATTAVSILRDARDQRERLTETSIRVSANQRSSRPGPGR